jgi:hypothetical protein
MLEAPPLQRFARLAASATSDVGDAVTSDVGDAVTSDVGDAVTSAVGDVGRRYLSNVEDECVRMTSKMISSLKQFIIKTVRWLSININAIIYMRLGALHQLRT